jgi:hypothetical protein
MPNIYQPFINVKLIQFKLFRFFKKGLQVQYIKKISSLVLLEERILSVYINTVPKKIFRPKREKVTGGQKKLHKEELHVFYLPNTLTVNKARGLWQNSVATEGHKRIWWKNRSARDHLKYINVDERIILKCVLKKYDGLLWTVLSGFR